MLKTRKIEGRFVGFEVNDYLHAGIQDAAGKTRWFHIGAQGLAYFLAINKGRVMTAVYDVAKARLSEGEPETEIQTLIWARFGQQDFGTWWTKESAGASLLDLDSRFESAIDAATLLVR